VGHSRLDASPSLHALRHLTLAAVAVRDGHAALTTTTASVLRTSGSPVSMSSRPSCGMRSQSRLPHSSAYSLRPDHHPQTASALSPPARTSAPVADPPLPRHIVSRQGQASAKRQACQRSHPNDQANISLLRLTIRAVQMALQHQPQRSGTPQRASHLALLH
jgi:hypothetical protein